MKKLRLRDMFGNLAKMAYQWEEEPGTKFSFALTSESTWIQFLRRWRGLCVQERK